MNVAEVGLARFHELYAVDWPYQMAAAVAVMVPLAILFFVAQKYLIEAVRRSAQL